MCTLLSGTHNGVPTRKTPARTLTPITIGSLELKIELESTIFNKQGNTAPFPLSNFLLCLNKGH